MNKETKTSLAHTSWNSKYHIVFAPKYRRRVFYGEKRNDIGAWQVVGTPTICLFCANFLTPTIP